MTVLQAHDLAHLLRLGALAVIAVWLIVMLVSFWGTRP